MLGKTKAPDLKCGGAAYLHLRLSVPTPRGTPIPLLPRHHLFSLDCQALSSIGVDISVTS